jgi:hypothetical protein
MPRKLLDPDTPSREDAPKRPEDLPRGLLTPPEWVREVVAREKAKFPAEVFTAEAEEELLCSLTLQHYFGVAGEEVLYRSTPEGPEVLAVGDEERLTLTRGMPAEERGRLSTWLP